MLVNLCVQPEAVHAEDSAEKELDISDRFTCPVCGKGVGASQIEQHVNACLDAPESGDNASTRQQSVCPICNQTVEADELPDHQLAHVFQQDELGQFGSRPITDLLAPDTPKSGRAPSSSSRIPTNLPRLHVSQACVDSTDSPTAPGVTHPAALPNAPPPWDGTLRILQFNTDGLDPEHVTTRARGVWLAYTTCSLICLC